ncbi:MAG TPA: AIR synthase related protein [Candidatus Nanoarchaeia archaeon]|nr:AIR synthase related protein [Candidatus Nanoarchaeia archaeon]
MGGKVDEYLLDIVEKGDKGSNLLEIVTAPTLKNCEFVDVYAGRKRVLHIPNDYEMIIHTAGGDPRETDPASHAASMVKRLVGDSKRIGATPIAFGNVIDSNTGDIAMLESIANALVSMANDNKLVIMNGENAILGPRVNPAIQANVMGTMISIIRSVDITDYNLYSLFIKKGMAIVSNTTYARFDHKGMAVHMNLDGIGTKTEFYERLRAYERGLADFAAMNLDDTAKSGARALGLFGMCEMNGDIPVNSILAHTGTLGQQIGVPIFLEFEQVGNRIMSYKPGVPAYNISGAAISLIDEERLMNPPKPSIGEHLIAIRGKPNPRSNGISDKRKIAVKLFGQEYQDTPEGREMLEFLAEPSTVLYPVFKKLLDENVATSVYHMSGGAYNGKLARPLAENGFYVHMEGLFEPDRREIQLSDAMNTATRDAYGKWPMGNDGFITTKDPDKAIKMIKDMGLEAKAVGRIGGPVVKEGAEYSGVDLKAFNGENVEYLYPVKKAA